MQTLENHFIDTSMGKLRYWQAGNEGEVLLIVHGFAVSVELWRNMINRLSRNYRVYAVDLIGHGLSDKPETLQGTVGEYAQCIGQFIDTMGLTQVNLLGHSMGAAAALQYANTDANKLKQLLLLTPAGLIKHVPKRFRLAAIPLMGELLMGSPTHFAIALLLRWSVNNPRVITPEVVDAIYNNAHRSGVKPTNLKTIRSNVTPLGIIEASYKSTQDAFNNCSVPTHIIVGQNDPLIPFAKIAQAIKPIINPEHFHVLTECGHLPHIEKPDALQQLLHRLLITHLNRRKVSKDEVTQLTSQHNK